VPAAVRAKKALLDPAYHAAFEAERARVLRRRIALCLWVILFLLSISTLGTFFEWAEYTDGEKTPLDVLLLGVLQDVSLTAIAIATLMYVWQAKPDRRHLVRVVILSTIITAAVAMYFDIRRAVLNPTDWLGDPAPDIDPATWGCKFGLLAYGLLATLALVIVPMRFREARWIAAGCWIAYVVQIALLTNASIPAIIGYSLLALVIVAPPIAFSHWRYTLFDAAFEHRELIGRYGEMSAELVNARKLHEAILPPPITTGPVRVRFVYEPMREIGGDFLFVSGAPDPLRQESAPAGVEPIYIVLIDVSGHGVASALAVNRLHGELVRYFGSIGESGGRGDVRERGGAGAGDGGGDPSAAEVIDALNSYVYLTLGPQGVFATALCVKIDARAPRTAVGEKGTGDRRIGGITVEWANAGHPPALLRRSDGTGEPASIEHLGSTATMLGVIEPREFEVKALRVALAPGDRVIAYTDGLMETRGAAGEEFGVARIESVVTGPLPSSTVDAAAVTAGAVASTAAPASGETAKPDQPASEAPASFADALLQAARLFRAAGRVTDDTLIVEIIAPEVDDRRERAAVDALANADASATTPANTAAESPSSTN
jgi:hypothetical protein